VIAVDTNILVHAHRLDSPWHGRATQCLQGLAEGPAQWAIPWPCVHEFLATVTRPRLFKNPTPVSKALAQIDAWMGSPSLLLLAEGDTHWPELCRIVAKGRVQGALVHDARVAALCSQNGVRELWTADRDFTRLPAMFVVRNPLIDDE